MQPNEEQVKELMTTVACAVCGVKYGQGTIEVLGHRDTLWFLKVSCAACSTCGLVAAMVKAADPVESEPVAETAPSDGDLDRPRRPGRITRAHVARMRTFLESFDGDFQALFSPESDQESRRSAS
jgi:hypothetical protein